MPQEVFLGSLVNFGDTREERLCENSIGYFKANVATRPDYQLSVGNEAAETLRQICTKADSGSCLEAALKNQVTFMGFDRARPEPLIRTACLPKKGFPSGSLWNSLSKPLELLEQALS